MKTQKVKKATKFRKVVEWNDKDFNSLTIYWSVSLIILPLLILWYLFFGWIYGIKYWINQNKENLEEYREVYWEKIE